MKSFQLSNEDIQTLCTAGSQAPSEGNIQAWKVIVKGNSFFLFLHPKRRETVLEIEKHASIFSLGCFLENVLIAARAHGIEFTLTFHDFVAIEKALVEITFTGRTTNLTDQDYFQAIEKRVTNRKLHDGQLLSDAIISKLESSFSDFKENIRLYTISSHDDKVKAADILGKADAVRMTNKKLFTEMVHEFRWDEHETNATRDGLDIRTLELPANVARMMQLMKNHPTVVSMFPEKAFETFTKPLVTHSSHICCLTVKEFDTTHLLEAGRAFERFWLLATQNDISLHPWTSLTFFALDIDFFGGQSFTEREKKQITEMQKQFKILLGIDENQIPLLIFRLTKAPSPKERSLRLPWDSFTTIEK